MSGAYKYSPQHVQHQLGASPDSYAAEEGKMSETQPAAARPDDGTIPYHQVYFGCCNRTVMTRADIKQPQCCPFCGSWDSVITPPLAARAPDVAEAQETEHYVFSAPGGLRHVDVPEERVEISGTVGLDGDTKREELVCRKHDVYYDPENKICVICEMRAALAALPASEPAGEQGIRLDPHFGDPYIWCEGMNHADALASNDYILIKATALRVALASPSPRVNEELLEELRKVEEIIDGHDGVINVQRYLDRRIHELQCAALADSTPKGKSR